MVGDDGSLAGDGELKGGEPLGQNGGGFYVKLLDNATNPKYMGYIQASSNFVDLEDMQKINDCKLERTWCIRT